MGDAIPSIIVTGISGNLGRRLLPMLTSRFRVVGVDFRPPVTDQPIRFEQMDLGEESSCLQLIQLFREVRPVAVVHLAFVMGVLDPDRMWKINVAGTARAMEAATEANRDWPMIEKFIFVSSVSAYGPGLAPPATESSRLAARDYLYGVHKMEADLVVQQRAPAADRKAAVAALRINDREITLAAEGALHRPKRPPKGAPESVILADIAEARQFRAVSPRGWWLPIRPEGTRLPCMLPSGQQYLNNKIQFVHVDDVSRLIAFILNKIEPESQRLTVLNVAGRGVPMSYGECVRLANAKLVRVPSEQLFKFVLHVLWRLRISTIPPDVAGYMTTDTVMNTTRLQEFLGADYKEVIRHPIAEAFAECFKKDEKAGSANA